MPATCTEKVEPQYEYHLKHYGHPSKFGYKDIIPLWKAERWDPEHLMGLYKKAGAKYFCVIAEHHDNFDCWNSKFQRWNSVNMGPKKDVVGIWARTARSHGLRFGVTEHLGATWNWWVVNKGADKQGPYAGVPYDGNDPKYQDLYLPPHEDSKEWYSSKAPEWWQRRWFNRIQDLVDSYQPDLLYSDGGIPFHEVGRSLVAHFYNANMQKHGGKLEAVYNCKKMPDYFEEGTCVEDVERGVMEGINPIPWQTDTCIGNWYYKQGIKYKSATTVITMLADIVSKNGNLLLNIPPRPDGSLDDEELAILRQMAAWMKINADAIFATRPWKVFGEGPIKAKGGKFGERNERSYTAEDIRFTMKGETLFAIALGWPDEWSPGNQITGDRCRVISAGSSGNQASGRRGSTEISPRAAGPRGRLAAAQTLRTCLCTEDHLPGVIGPGKHELVLDHDCVLAKDR